MVVCDRVQIIIIAEICYSTFLSTQLQTLQALSINCTVSPIYSVIEGRLITGSNYNIIRFEFALHSFVRWRKREYPKETTEAQLENCL